MVKIINWLRENPLLFHFSNSRVGLGVHLFYANSTEEAKQLITNWIMIYSDDIEDIEKLSWEDDSAHPGVPDSIIWKLNISISDEEDEKQPIGWLKLVNERIVPVEEAVKAVMAKNDKDRERMDEKFKKWYEEIQRKNPYPDDYDRQPWERQRERNPWGYDPRTMAQRRQYPSYKREELE